MNATLPTLLFLLALAAPALADDAGKAAPPEKPVGNGAKPAEEGASPTEARPKPAAPRAKPAEATVAKVKWLLDKAGESEKKRAKAEAAGKSADAAAALEARDRALTEARAVEVQARFDGLVRAIVGGAPAEARRLAAEEIAALKEPVSAGAIVKGFVREAEKPVRIAESRLLVALAEPDTAVWLLRALDEPAPERRIRAMQGLSLFRDARSVPVLIQLVQQIAGGFGRAAIEISTDRSYVSGWRMVSGGTGLTVVEVADPEVDVIREGVSVEVKVRTVEMRFAVGLLQDLTGQSIGADPGAWSAWLAANPKFVLAPAKDAPAKPVDAPGAQPGAGSAPPGSPAQPGAKGS